jgi:hypothetical protein
MVPPARVRHGGMGTLTCLGYFMVVGAITASLIGTAARSEAQSQKTQTEGDKAPQKPMINLMRLTDPLTDIVRGKWSKNGNLLRCDDQHFVPRIQIRYEPPEEYDFIVQFSQKKLRHPVAAMMPNRHGGSFVWQVGLRDGNDFRIQADPAKDWSGKAPGLVKVNTLHTTIVEVRRNSIRCIMDGKVLLKRQTNFKELTIDVWNKMPDPSLLGVGCDDPTVFHNIRLVEVSGPGKQR